MTANEFYNYITSQITPEQALMKLLEGAVIQYENLKFDDQQKAVHPIHIIAMAAMDMGWDIAFKSDDLNINGLSVGTEEYIKSIFKRDTK